MRELVIVVSDLYLAEESSSSDPRSPPPLPLPGLERIVRFGTRQSLNGSWRRWLANWAGAGELAAAAPATVATVATVPTPATVPTAATIATVPAAPAAPAMATESPSWVWLASAVHLVAGLSTLHFDRRSLLRLPPAEGAVLASEFNRTFLDSGFHLKPLDTGDFLLFGPGEGSGGQPDPATLMGGNVADAHQTSAAEHKALRRLGAESEMWLHSHAINDARVRRGVLPITGLWFWGGGPSRVSASDARKLGVSEAAGADVPVAFAKDAFVSGLWTALGSPAQPLPTELSRAFSYPVAERAVLVLELGPMLHSNPSWSFLNAMSYADRTYLAPAMAALSAGRLRQVTLLANGCAFVVSRRDLLRFWRRQRPGLTGLQ